ncbi:MAG: hypothetical protein EAZ85_07945 [Bacteroidetes bacterium]|nr:MAG: hypothetical protein EAZ85_07945 [Bacteroidota bacterium]
MKNEIRIALCKKITEKFGKNLQKHSEFVDLAVKTDLAENTLKRLFDIKGHQDCKNQLARQDSQQKIICFLGYESWEILMCELEILAYPKETAQELAKLRKNKPSK